MLFLQKTPSTALVLLVTELDTGAAVQYVLYSAEHTLTWPGHSKGFSYHLCRLLESFSITCSTPLLHFNLKKQNAARKSSLVTFPCGHKPQAEPLCLDNRHVKRAIKALFIVHPWDSWSVVNCACVSIYIQAEISRLVDIQPGLNSAAPVSPIVSPLPRSLGTVLEIPQQRVDKNKFALCNHIRGLWFSCNLPAFAHTTPHGFNRAVKQKSWIYILIRQQKKWCTMQLFSTHNTSRAPIPKTQYLPPQTTPQVYILIITSYGKQYTFDQPGSTVLAFLPSSFLCTWKSMRIWKTLTAW